MVPRYTAAIAAIKSKVAHHRTFRSLFDGTLAILEFDGVGSCQGDPSAIHQVAPRCEAVLDQRPDRFETVARADLLPFRDASRIVADRHFVNPIAQPPGLGSHF